MSIMVGQGEFRFRVVEDWARLPAGWNFGEVAAVAVDSRDRVYVFSRCEHPVCVFAPDGSFLTAWGEGILTHAHGLTIAPDDTVWCTDDWNHSVRRFSPQGELLQTLGTPGHPSATGIEGLDYRTIRQPAGPFNLPTNLAVSATGDLFVADGYGNCRVHQFAPTGTHLNSFGEPGTGPGEFQLPHGIAIDTAGILHVADRENSRIQQFTLTGEPFGEWRSTCRPMQVRFDREGRAWVCELGLRAGRFPWLEVPTHPPGARIKVFDPVGEVLVEIGEGDDPCAPGQFFAPHDLAIDSRGDLYVAEVVLSAGGNRGLVDPTCHCLQKFERL